MKANKITVIICGIFLSTALYSQDNNEGNKAGVDQIKDNTKDQIEQINTVFGKQRFMPGGYIANVFKMSQIGNNDLGYFVGLRTAFIMNHHIAIGGTVNVLVNPLDRGRLGGYTYTEADSTTNFLYGGLLIEYYIFPKSVVNVGISATIGGGGLIFQDGNYWHYQQFNIHAANGFFAIEPEINLNINVTRFFRIVLGASYRYVNGIKSANFSDASFSGFGGTAMLQFGWF